MAKTPTSNIEKALSGGGPNEAPLDMEQFIKMADLEKIEFDVMQNLADTIKEDFERETKDKPMTFMDWLNSKDDDYFKRLSYAGGGKVIQFPLDLTKYKDIKPKEINLSGSFDKDRTIDSLSSDERALVNRLLRMSLGKGEK